jgi:glutamate-1-semialdehyde 2,1-aminomutase
MGSFIITREAITDITSVQQASAEAYGQYLLAMRGRGVYLAPSAFEAVFISLAQSQEDLEKTLAAAEESFREIKF